ncbi:MAG: uroporphyrinogen decarboxylase family protein [Planctomycetota bacterium]|jgi:uroporphyrinogen decarboxylase
MTGKERMLAALAHEETDRPPHFEIMFELEREAFGLEFPNRTVWATCSASEKVGLIDRCMEVYQAIVERYHWDALAVYWPWSDPDGVAAAKKTFGESILIGSIVGNTIHSIENTSDWMEFSVKLMDRPEEIHALDKIDELTGEGTDFIHLVNDIAFNAGTFIAPNQVSEFCLPYLTEQVARVRDRNAIPFIHSDGNLMPILEEWIGTGAACFQSVDPMAGMDIAEVKRICSGRMALMGNVQCNLLQDGPREAIRESVLYCLEHASAGGGFIFSTSNTIFPGMPLEHYEYMLEVFEEFCQERAGATA